MASKKSTKELSDPKLLAVRMRELDMTDLGRSSESLSLAEIQAQMSETKRRYEEEKNARKKKKYVPPGGWKKEDPMITAARGKGKPDPIEKAKTITNISKYRELQKPRIWDAGFYPSEALKKTLYRPIGGDTSGHRIFNLSREAYPKDIPAQWKPGAYDKPFGTPSLELVTDSYRNMLTRHVSSIPPKVEADYKTLPNVTTNERNFKATVASDLAKTRQAEEEVLKEFERIDKIREEQEAKMKTVRASRAVSRNSKSRSAMTNTNVTVMEEEKGMEKSEEDKGEDKNKVDGGECEDAEGEEEGKEGGAEE